MAYAFQHLLAASCCISAAAALAVYIAPFLWRFLHLEQDRLLMADKDKAAESSSAALTENEADKLAGSFEGCVLLYLLGST